MLILSAPKTSPREPGEEYRQDIEQEHATLSESQTGGSSSSSSGWVLKCWSNTNVQTTMLLCLPTGLVRR